MLIACGQKGALYLPSEEPSSVVSNESSASEGADVVSVPGLSQAP